jgi:transglutaminase-like putative cysteine protease
MGSLPANCPRPADRFFEYSLLGLVASGYFAVAGSGFLDAPTVAGGGAALILRALMVAGVLRLRISARAVAAAAVAYMAFYPIDYFFLSREFLGATVHLVLFVAVVKILTCSTPRDYLWVKVIALLELLAASVLSPNLSFFVFLAAFLVFGAATLSSGEVRRSTGRADRVARGAQRSLAWRLAGVSLIASLGALALTAGMFFLLPRTARAAFRHLVPDRYRVPGFSNQITLGEMGQLKRLGTPVMHVRFFTPGRYDGLKWRGAALSEFDGKRWYNPPGGDRLLRMSSTPLQLVDDDHRRLRGRRAAYEVRLRSTGTGVLFFAGAPEFLDVRLPLVIRTASGGYRTAEGASEGLRYGVYSNLDSGIRAPAPVLSSAERQLNIKLPQPDARVIGMARRITAGARDDRERARAVEEYLRANYSYTTGLDETTPADPIAHFLLERRKGHCEYFASAMALMLRYLGVPARVATGFQSGVYNPVSGWYLIRASDAHSWVEAWIEGQGWTTFDPTPPDPGAEGASLWARALLYVDAAETFWQDWVLSYDLDRQLVLATRMEESGRLFGSSWPARTATRLHAWRDAVERWGRRFGFFALAAAVLAVLLHYAGPGWWRRLRAEWRIRHLDRAPALASDATLLYQRMLRLLGRRGIQKPAWVTPAEFAVMLKKPELSELVVRITGAYHDLRFGDRPAAAPRMIALLDQLDRAR